jgi:osmotically-inducible protein OsmY
VAVITVSRQLASLGTVILWGAVGSGTDRENCERAAARLEGVKRVDNRLLVTEYYRFGS